MIVGILSDTHGRADAANAAVKLLLEHGAQQLIHCGDVGDPAVLDAMTLVPATFVFGNNDWDRAALRRYASDLGITCGDNAIELQLDGKRALLTHGDDAGLVQRAIDQQQVDYLMVGHSHRRHDERFGRLRLINPGALFRAREKTVALLDVASDVLQFLTVTGV